MSIANFIQQMITRVLGKAVNNSIEKTDAVIAFGQANQFADVNINGDVAHQINNTIVNISQDQPESLFTSDSPFPKGYDIIKPGTRLSVVLSVYPKQKESSFIGSMGYRTKLEDKLFTFASFGLNYIDDKNLADPDVRLVSYSFRNDSAKQYIYAEALKVFGANNATTELAGHIIVWRDIKGYELRLDGYRLEISKTEHDFF